MIIVDSSVWINYFNGVDTAQTNKLDEILDTDLIGIRDIILTEVLQGFRFDKDYRAAKQVLTSLTIFKMLDFKIAIQSADNFRFLRKKGITIRKRMRPRVDERRKGTRTKRRMMLLLLPSV